jgi:hypothetical protein
MNHQQKIRTPTPKLKTDKYTKLTLDDDLIEAPLLRRSVSSRIHDPDWDLSLGD